MLRCQSKLEAYCGPDPVGGSSDSTSLLLALVLLTQMRRLQGLSSYWAFGDIKWAFDMANQTAMKWHVFKAGVQGLDRLLFDDFLDQDAVCCHLMHLLSDKFQLEAGTAQGRRFSLHSFNCHPRECACRPTTFCCSGTKACAAGGTIRTLEAWPHIPARFA